VQQLGLGIILIAAAMVINGAVGLALIRIGRRQGSMTLEADGHHLLSDAITSATALGALGLVKLLNWPLADPIAALLIAAYIGWMGISLLRRSSAGLMDRQDANDERLLRQILDSHIGASGKEPKICSYHKLRHRHSGRYHWVDFHIMVPGKLDIDRGHAIASAIEYEIERALGEGNATAHIEPCAERPCELGDGQD
jgi:cation diffusion facilitator family transporter